MLLKRYPRLTKRDMACVAVFYCLLSISHAWSLRSGVWDLVCGPRVGIGGKLKTLLIMHKIIVLLGIKQHGLANRGIIVARAYLTSSQDSHRGLDPLPSFSPHEHLTAPGLPTP